MFLVIWMSTIYSAEKKYPEIRSMYTTTKINCDDIMIRMTTKIMMTILIMLGTITFGHVECHDFEVIVTIPFVMSWMYSEMPFCFTLSHFDLTACIKEVLRLSHLRLTSRGASLLLQALWVWVISQRVKSCITFGCRKPNTVKNRTNYPPTGLPDALHQYVIN